MSSALPAVRAERRLILSESLDPSKRAGQHRLREDLGQEQDEAECGRLLDEADGQLTETKDQLDEALRQVKETQAELQQARAEVAAKSFVVETQRAEVKALSCEVETQRAEAKAKQAELQEARAEAEARQTELEQLKAQLQKANSQMQSPSLLRLRDDEGRESILSFHEEDAGRDSPPGDATPQANFPNSSSATSKHSLVSEGAPELVDEPIVPRLGLRAAGILPHFVDATAIRSIRECLDDILLHTSSEDVPASVQRDTKKQVELILSHIPAGTSIGEIMALLLGSQTPISADQSPPTEILRFFFSQSSIRSIRNHLRAILSIHESVEVPANILGTTTQQVERIKFHLPSGTNVDEQILSFLCWEPSIPADQRPVTGILRHSIDATRVRNIQGAVQNIRSLCAPMEASARFWIDMFNQVLLIESCLPTGTTWGVGSGNRLAAVEASAEPIAVAPNETSKPEPHSTLADAENCPPQPPSGIPPSRRSKRRHKTSN
jgi:hypothetical protein